MGICAILEAIALDFSANSAIRDWNSFLHVAVLGASLQWREE